MKLMLLFAFCFSVWCLQATDLYKRMLLENRDDLALNVYVAMCYYKVSVDVPDVL